MVHEIGRAQGKLRSVTTRARSKMTFGQKTSRPVLHVIIILSVLASAVSWRSPVVLFTTICLRLRQTEAP